MAGCQGARCGPFHHQSPPLTVSPRRPVVVFTTAIIIINVDKKFVYSFFVVVVFAPMSYISFLSIISLCYEVYEWVWITEIWVNINLSLKCLGSEDINEISFPRLPTRHVNVTTTNIRSVFLPMNRLDSVMYVMCPLTLWQTFCICLFTPPVTLGMIHNQT